MFSKKDYYLAQKLVHTVLNVQSFAMENFADLYLSHFNDFDQYIGFDEETMGKSLSNMRMDAFALYFAFNVKVKNKCMRDLYLNHLLVKGKQKKADWVALSLKKFRYGVFRYEKRISGMRILLSTVEGPKETFELIHLPQPIDDQTTKYVFCGMVFFNNNWWTTSYGVGTGNMESDALRYYLLASGLDKAKYPWIIAKLHIEDMHIYLDKKLSVMFKGI